MFAFEIIEGSLAAMLSILIALVILVRKLQSVSVDAWWQWAAFKFPFQIHCGWIWAAACVNANVLLVSLELASSVQVIAAWATFGILAVVSAYYLLGAKNYVVPSVVAWATYAVRVELQSPRDSIANMFDAETISMLSLTSFVLAITVLVATVAFGGYQFYQQRKQQRASSDGPTQIDYDTMNN